MREHSLWRSKGGDSCSPSNGPTIPSGFGDDLRIVREQHAGRAALKTASTPRRNRELARVYEPAVEPHLQLENPTLRVRSRGVVVPEAKPCQRDRTLKVDLDRMPLARREGSEPHVQCVGGGVHPIEEIVDRPGIVLHPGELIDARGRGTSLQGRADERETSVNMELRLWGDR